MALRNTSRSMFSARRRVLLSEHVSPTIHIRYDDAIRPNTNRLFRPLFGTEANTNRIFGASLRYTESILLLEICSSGAGGLWAFLSNVRLMTVIVAVDVVAVVLCIRVSVVTSVNVISRAAAVCVDHQVLSDVRLSFYCIAALHYIILHKQFLMWPK